MASEEPIRRFSVHVVPANGNIQMLERSDGDWVKYSDIADALVAAHQRGWDEAMEAAQKAASPNSGPGIFSEYENGRRDAARAIRQLEEEQ